MRKLLHTTTPSDCFPSAFFFRSEGASRNIHSSDGNDSVAVLMRTNKLRSPIRPRKKGFDMFAKRFKRVRKSGLPQRHAACEILESRRHLTVTGNVSAGHTLSVIGDTNGQTITLSGSGSTIAVLANGVPISGSPFAGVTTAIYVSADSGADNVDVSAVTNALPVTLLGGNGNDTLKGTTSADTFSGSNGDDDLLPEI